MATDLSRRSLFALGAAALAVPLVPALPAADVLTLADVEFASLYVRPSWGTIKVGDIFTFGESTVERWEVTHAH